MIAKEGIIFQASRYRLKRRLKSLGDILLSITFFGLILNFGPIIQKEINYRQQKKVDQQIGFNNLNLVEISTPIIAAPDPYFSLVIPKIKAEAKIFANTDTKNSQKYKTVLQKGIAHAKGTVFPGMIGTTYLFAHSTNAPWNISHYNAVFYLLNKLEAKDEIIVFFQGKRFNYLVREKKIVSPRETDFFNQESEEILVLQTCYPPGTTQKALLVFAERDKNY